MQKKERYGVPIDNIAEVGSVGFCCGFMDIQKKESCEAHTEPAEAMVNWLLWESEKRVEDWREVVETQESFF